jgi:alkyl hydroperoxide reductase subunit AhpC
VAMLISPGEKAVVGSVPTRAMRSLRNWLKNDWVVLFSHPEDFANGDLESDRWLSILRESFAAHSIRPIAVGAPSHRADHSWIAQVNNDLGMVSLDDPFRDGAQQLDVQALRLSKNIAAMHHRFVMIIDAMLSLRRVYSYMDRTRLPSPLDFIGWVIVIRASESSVRQPNQRPSVVSRGSGEQECPQKSFSCETIPLSRYDALVSIATKPWVT